MENILYGDSGSERMIFNETGISETVVSELYRNVRIYSFGYRLLGNTGMWYYVNKYNQRGAGYISCVCDDLPASDEDAYADFSAPLDLFDLTFHTISEFEDEYRNGSYQLVQYQVFYPSEQHIEQMYQKLLDVLPNNGKIIVYMPSPYGRDVFISNALNLLARFLYVLPIGLRNLISFSVGEENSADNANISIVSSREAVGFGDVFIDTTDIPETDIMQDTLPGYWTKCFDNDDCFDDTLETLFEFCVNENEILKESIYSKTFSVPYRYLYDFQKNTNYENYNSLKLNSSGSVNFEKLGEYFDLDEFRKVEFEKSQEEKKRREAEIKKAAEEEKRKIEEKKKKFEESYQGWVAYLDEYVEYMKSKEEGTTSDDEEQQKKDYEKIITFFGKMSRIAEVKARDYYKSVEQSSPTSNSHWTSSDWEVHYNNDLNKIEKKEKVSYSLVYSELFDDLYQPFNRYSGLLLYLESIKAVNYIDEELYKKISEDPLNTSKDYNHCCYDRKVMNVIYYNSARNNNLVNATYDYREFLNIAALICLYVFVDDIKDDNSVYKNLDKETIKELMMRYFNNNESLKNVALYHCTFLYSSVMGFFENALVPRRDRRIVSDEVQRKLARWFKLSDSINWLRKQFQEQARNRIYNNTLRAFVMNKNNGVVNFNIKSQMERFL